MGVAVALIMLAGIIINSVLCGVNALNFILAVISLVILAFNLPFTKKVIMKKAIKINFTVISALFHLCILTVLALVIISANTINQNKGFAAKINASSTLIQNKDYDKAAEALSQLADEYPADADVNLNSAALYLRMGNLDQARQYIDTAYRIRPFDTDILFNYGMVYYILKDYRNANSFFEQVCIIDPYYVEARVYAGMCNYMLRNLRKAIYHFENASVLDPESPEIYYSLGTANLDLCMYPAAKAFFNSALESNPSTALKAEIQKKLSAMKELDFKGVD